MIACYGLLVAHEQWVAAKERGLPYEIRRPESRAGSSVVVVLKEYAARGSPVRIEEPEIEQMAEFLETLAAHGVEFDAETQYGLWFWRA